MEHENSGKNVRPRNRFYGKHVVAPANFYLVNLQEHDCSYACTNYAFRLAAR